VSFLDKISVIILTSNEAQNIARTLDALSRFSEIVIVDSGSIDETVEIVGRFANTRVVTRTFDSHARQWNHGLTSSGIRRPWILALDADYVVSSALVDEIAALQPESVVAGYRVPFRYCVCGRTLSASLYPPALALYRREQAKYIQQGHTQRALVNGSVRQLKAYICHDDRKPFARWIAAQQRYAKLEADYLTSAQQGELRLVDRLRLMAVPVPFLVFLYTLFVKRCLFDGWPGWLYVLQRTLAETMIAAEIIEKRLRS
jgi:glycosyltransferase involved in cell wall biosynthesis